MNQQLIIRDTETTPDYLVSRITRQPFAYKGLTFNSLQAANDSPIMFNPIEAPIFTMESNLDIEKLGLIKTHKSILREKNNAFIPLGIVGREYKPVDNVLLFNFIHNKISTHLDTSDVTVHDSFVKQGAITIRQVIFNKHSFQIKGNDVKLKLIIINSFDGSKAFKLYFGLIDFFCMNGLVTGTYNMLTRKHTKGFNIPNIEKVVSGIKDNFIQEERNIQHLASMSIKDTSVVNFFGSIYKDNDKTKDRILEQYMTVEAPLRGNNLWSVISAKTSLIHDNVKQTKNASETYNLSKLKKETDTFKLYTSKEFQDLIHYTALNEVYPATIN